MASKNDKEDKALLSKFIFAAAASEPTKEKVKVGFIPINRISEQKEKFGSNLKEVLYNKRSPFYEVNSRLFKLADSPKKMNDADKKAWGDSQKVASLIMDKRIDDPTKGAVFMLAPNEAESASKAWPRWNEIDPDFVEGSYHRFYRFSGGE